ncbi:MAG: LysR family transcriptional regulator, partial [Bradymonadaceae bacterium]
DRQLRDVWNWLPAFRAVAETEHLPSAAERLHVTPAAISRTLNLLEERIGQKLFNRDGRALVLNENGEKLLEEVRSGMLGVERGLKRIAGAPLDGPVRVSSMGVLTDYFVTPGLLRIVDEYDGALPVIRNMRT